MRSALHNVQLGKEREARDVIIVEGCEECVAKFRAKLSKLIAEAKEEAKSKPCGCKDKENVS